MQEEGWERRLEAERGAAEALCAEIEEKATREVDLKALSTTNLVTLRPDYGHVTARLWVQWQIPRVWRQSAARPRLSAPRSRRRLRARSGCRV